MMTLTCDRDRLQHYEERETATRFFSVSEVCDLLDPDAFQYVPEDILAAAGERGKVLHEIFALWLLGQEAYVPPALQGYADSARRWIDLRQPQARKVEEASVNRDLGYAGRPDALVWCADRSVLTLPDLKTGAHRLVHESQILAYGHLEGYTEATDRLLLYLQKDGKLAKEVRPAHPAMAWAWFQNGLGVLRGRLALNGRGRC